MYSCPHPECSHAGQVITNNHCMTEHGTSKNDLFEMYGKPERIGIDNNKLKQNRPANSGRVNDFATRDYSRDNVQKKMSKYYR